MPFNRDRNRDGGDRGGFRSRPSFGDRPRFGGGDRPRFGGGDRGPVEMHDAVCDNCGKNCQVPFRPTSGKPVYCSDCFEKQRGFEPRRSEGRGDFRGNREDNGSRREQAPSYNQNDLSQLSAKLDKIISLLTPAAPMEQPATQEVVMEEVTPVKEPKKKPAKKSSKKS